MSNTDEPDATSSEHDPVEEVAQSLPGGGKLDGPTGDELADEAGGPIQVP